MISEVQSLPQTNDMPAEKNFWRNIPRWANNNILLRFSQTRKLLSSKAAFTIVFFAAVNHNYDHKQ